MARPSKAVQEFMAKYTIASDEIWEVHGTTWVVKHKALERVAAEQGITFGPPTVEECNTKEGIIALWVPGQLGERKEWAFGEASPKNNKNSYPWAMAEKRAKDRVILKLLNGHGDLYSEDEADDFKQPRQNVARQEDDDTIERQEGVQVLTVDAQRPIFSELKADLDKCFTVEECKQWKLMVRSKASRLSDHWKKVLEEHYKDRKRECEKLEADEYIERMTG